MGDVANPRVAPTFVKLTLPHPGRSKVLDLRPEEQTLVASPISLLRQLHPTSVRAPLPGTSAFFPLPFLLRALVPSCEPLRAHWCAKKAHTKAPRHKKEKRRFCSSEFVRNFAAISVEFAATISPFFYVPKRSMRIFITAPPGIPAATAMHLLMFALLITTTTGCGTKSTTKKPGNDPPASTPKTQPADGQTDNAKPEILDRDAVIAKADELAGQQDFSAASAELRKLLLVNPQDVEVLFRVAGIEAQAGKLAEAVDLLDEIPADHPEAGLPALGQSADWCFQLKRYDEAERRYREVLTRAPSAAPALRQLAYLLNRQGRRHEAGRHIRQLCRLGNVRQDELHALIALSVAMYDEPTGSPATAAGQYPYWPIGPWGEARKLLNDEEYQQAAELLYPSIADGSAPPAIVALYGRIVAEAQEDAKFHWWLSQTNQQTHQHAEYWAALGTHLVSQRKFKQAARALAEAIDRDPTDMVSMSRMRQTLATLGDDEGAQKWFDRWNEVRNIIDTNNRVATADQPDLDAMEELASMLLKQKRPLESLLWRSIRGHYQGAPLSEMQKLNQQRQQLLTSKTAFPDQQARLCGLDIDAYPLPKIEPVSAPLDPVRKEIEPPSVVAGRFVDGAASVGLHHTFHVESQPIKQRFSIYQTLGGGVAVLDYDLDGAPDLYLAQGGGDPPTFRGTQTNQLFQHRGGRLADVTDQASLLEHQYSIGVTTGDWNQDGFADLIVANIGVNMLMINNGDGTFAGHPIDPQPDTNRVPTSAALADITGDRLPDLFQVFYVDDPTMTVKPPVDEAGRVKLTVSPNNFDPCPDWLVKNDGRGRFELEVQTLSALSEACAGLGVVITDFDGSDGNEVFVGNDTFPNQLWRQNPSGNQLSDTAPLLGCAYGFSGGATGAMGIATGDFDRSGTLDIHITNYENENSNLYLNKEDAYQDRNVQYRLGAASRNLVGFGSQAIDYDNDGRLDLVATNGHLDDAKSIRGTYRQPLQLFQNLGDQFRLIDFAESPGYCGNHHVGRGLAKLDFNQDGKLDFVITHVEQPTALLINETPSDHHWLQIRLVGKISERDSIGARVHVRAGGNEWTAWVTAGDGYLSRNENIVCFGLGHSSSIDEVTVDWPTGKQQHFKQLPANQRLLIVENEQEPYTLFEVP